MRLGRICGRTTTHPTEAKVGAARRESSSAASGSCHQPIQGRNVFFARTGRDSSPRASGTARRRVAAIWGLRFRVGPPRAAAQGDEELLDALHVTLGVISTEGRTYARPPYREIDRILAIGRSAWTATEEGLVHRADPTGQKAFEVAIATPGSATTELSEAWIHAHERKNKAGDAWDHAIKAVEAVLIPIVVPTKRKANLGDVIGHLRGAPHVWQLGIRGQNRDHGIEPLVAMLTLLWPDPNRHGSPTPEPEATPEEGRAMVNIAVTVVQWVRDGLVGRT